MVMCTTFTRPQSKSGGPTDNSLRSCGFITAADTAKPLTSGLAQSWLKPVVGWVGCPRKASPLCILKARGSEETFGLARDLKESPAQIPHASVFYPQQLILLDSVVVFSYYLDIFIHAIAPPAAEAREVLMPCGNSTMAISLNSL